LSSEVNWLTCEKRSVGLALGNAREKLINPYELDPAKHLSRTCALAIWDYLSREPDLETGCLILKEDDKFAVVPFINTDLTAVTVRMGAIADFDRMVEFHLAGKLWGWAHSHPHGAPYPSMTDLKHHSVPVNMVIWGAGLKRMSIYSTSEVNLLYEYVTKREPGLRPLTALERLCKTT